MGCYFREPGATQRNRAERRAPLRSPTRQGTHKSSKTLPTPQTTLKVHTQALQLTPSPPARSTRPEPTKSVSQATLSSLNLRKQSVSVLLKHKPRSKRSELTSLGAGSRLEAESRGRWERGRRNLEIIWREFWPGLLVSETFRSSFDVGYIVTLFWSARPSPL